MKIIIKTLFILTVYVSGIIACGNASIFQTEKQNMVLNLYWLIDGPPDGEYLDDFEGPENGFLGKIRDITKSTALGRGLGDAQILSCSDIPSSSDEIEMIDSDGIYKIDFETPTKIIPTGFVGANGVKKFDKRVSVSFEDNHFMDIELNCDNSSRWIRYADPEMILDESINSAQHIEAYYGANTNGSRKFEIVVSEEKINGDKEYYVAKFETISENQEFEFWITRATEIDSSQLSYRIAGKGNYQTKQVNAYMQVQGNHVNTNITISDVNYIWGGGDISCIDFVDNASVVEAADPAADCADFTLREAPAMIIDSDGDMSIENTANVAKLKAALTAL